MTRLVPVAQIRGTLWVEWLCEDSEVGVGGACKMAHEGLRACTACSTMAIISSRISQNAFPHSSSEDKLSRWWKWQQHLIIPRVDGRLHPPWANKSPCLKGHKCLLLLLGIQSGSERGSSIYSDILLTLARIRTLCRTVLSAVCNLPRVLRLFKSSYYSTYSYPYLSIMLCYTYSQQQSTIYAVPTIVSIITGFLRCWPRAAQLHSPLFISTPSLLLPL